jgi:hypothetical protein
MASVTMNVLILLLGSVHPASSIAEERRLTTEGRANPIRKVVTLLQKMQKQVTEEGEKEKELYDRFMCYCKTGSSDLEASIAGSGTKISQLGSDIQKAKAEKEETLATLKQAQMERDTAKTNMAEATGIRDSEAAAYASEKAEYGANIDAIEKAVAALEKGMAGSFLQTQNAQLVQKLAMNSQKLFDEDRNNLLAFLSGTASAEYAPSSGQVVGILKTLHDEMASGLASATATEENAIKGYEGLMAAKTKEVLALSAAIEAKLKKAAELGVSIAQMSNDLTDTEEALLADKEFLANLESACKTKTAEWEERVTTRG